MKMAIEKISTVCNHLPKRYINTVILPKPNPKLNPEGLWKRIRAMAETRFILRK